ncbi:MAG: hypothetical protein KAS23_03440 [Anaerohalosphaera sp.]|nr:hypothetical protein [Anaerohalosphaera sp.]
MKNKKVNVMLLLLAVCSIGTVLAMGQMEKAKKELLRVGIFDSRAVAIAFAASDFNDKQLKAKMAERDKAKADGDTEKLAELVAWGSARQEKRHRQGFGTAPVDDMLKFIEKDIPKIAKDAGVDIIISKWDMIYQAEDAELIDITDQIVKPFKPNDRALKWIDGIKKHKPLTEDELDNMDHSKH